MTDLVQLGTSLVSNALCLPAACVKPMCDTAFNSTLSSLDIFFSTTAATQSIIAQQTHCYTEWKHLLKRGRDFPVFIFHIEEKNRKSSNFPPEKDQRNSNGYFQCDNKERYICKPV